jgi:hypothetical protein
MQTRGRVVPNDLRRVESHRVQAVIQIFEKRAALHQRKQLEGRRGDDLCLTGSRVVQPGQQSSLLLERQGGDVTNQQSRCFARRWQRSGVWDPIVNRDLQIRPQGRHEHVGCGIRPSDQDIGAPCANDQPLGNQPCADRGRSWGTSLARHLIPLNSGHPTSYSSIQWRSDVRTSNSEGDSIRSVRSCHAQNAGKQRVTRRL